MNKKPVNALLRFVLQPKARMEEDRLGLSAPERWVSPDACRVSNPELLLICPLVFASVVVQAINPTNASWSGLRTRYAIQLY
jgi:hypothetical protein